MDAEMSEEKKESVHLWTCDNDGGVHVLFNVQCNGVDDCSKTWRECDGDVSVLRCSSDGVTCGVSGGSQLLAFRTRITYDSPLGKKWAVSEASMRVGKLAVGGNHLAMVSPTDDRHVTTCSIPPRTMLRDTFDYAHSPLPPPPEGLHHIVMDSADSIYGITSVGNVFVYRGMGSSNSTWELLTKPPPTARRGGFLSSLFSSQRELFIDVTVSDGNLYMLRTSPQEIWQLVNKEVVMGGKTEHKCAWNSFKFKPNAPAITLITSNPLNHSELFAVTEANDIVQLNLKGKTITINTNTLPYHGLGDIQITSLSSCRVSHNLHNLTNATPLYPKLPKLCCEKGECEKCKGKSAIINITQETNWQTRYKEELMSSVNKWREGEEYYLPRLIDTNEEKRKRRKRTLSSESGLTDEELPSAKRLSGIFHRDIPRRGFIEGISVFVKNDRLYNYAQVQYGNIQEYVPIDNSMDSLDNIDLELPSLLIEERIVNGSIGLVSYPMQESQSSMEESQSGMEESQSGMEESCSQTSMEESCSQTSMEVSQTSMGMESPSMGSRRPVIGNTELVLKRSPNTKRSTKYYTALESMNK